MVFLPLNHLVIQLMVLHIMEIHMQSLIFIQFDKCY